MASAYEVFFGNDGGKFARVFLNANTDGGVFTGTFSGHRLRNHQNANEIDDCVLSALMHKVEGSGDINTNELTEGFMAFIARAAMTHANTPDGATVDPGEKDLFNKMMASIDKFADTLPLTRPGAKGVYTFKLASATSSTATTTPVTFTFSTGVKQFYEEVRSKFTATATASGPAWSEAGKANVEPPATSGFAKALFALALKQPAAPSGSFDSLGLPQNVADKKHRFVRQKDASGKVILVDSEDSDNPVSQNAAECKDAGIDETGCPGILQCLISGSPKAIADCLSDATYNDAFNNAKKDLKNMANAPKLAVKFLKKFNVAAESVTAPNGQTVIVPVHKNVWFNGLDQETQDALKASTSVKAYIEALIDNIRESPSIINKNYTGTGVSAKATPFEDAVGLKMFRQPRSGKRDLSYQYRLMERMPTVSANPGLFGLMTNVRMSWGGATPSTAMSGGCMTGGSNLVRPHDLARSVSNRMNDGVVKCGNAQESMYVNLKRNLADAGFKVSDRDNAVIEAEIAKMKGLESKFGQVHDILARLIEVKDLYGLPDHVGEPKVINLSDIASAEDFNRYVTNNIPQLNNYMNSNLSAQGGIAQQLQQLFTALVGKAAGVQPGPSYGSYVDLGDNLP